jgi:hypothetical protein
MREKTRQQIANTAVVVNQQKMRRVVGGLHGRPGGGCGG